MRLYLLQFNIRSLGVVTILLACVVSWSIDHYRALREFDTFEKLNAKIRKSIELQVEANGLLRSTIQMQSESIDELDGVTDGAF